MSRDDNGVDYSGFPLRPVLNGTGFGLIVIEFLAGSGLFSQIRDEFGSGSGIVTPAPSCPDYILKIFFYYFILHFNIINNYYYYNIFNK